MSDPYAEFSKPVGGNDPYAEFSKPVSAGKPSYQAAIKALSEASGALDKQLAGLPEEARRIGRQKFNADPRIKDLVAQVNAGLPKEEPSTLGQLWDATKNTVGGAVQGIASIPDVTTEAIAGGMRLGTRAIGAGGGALLDATGNPEAANQFRAGAEQYDRALSQPFTISRAVEKVAPTPTDTTGKVVRTLSQFAGGAATPMPAALSPAKVPFKAPPQTLSQVASPAADIVEEGAKRGVRVMTSDVKPPTTFVGKLTQSVGEKIPFAGTGGVRAGQQTQRVQAVKDVLREFGGDDAVQLFDDAPGAVEQVAADLIKRRGTQLGKLTAAKDAVIDGTQGAVPTPNAVRAIDEQIARLNGINDEVYAPVVKELESFKRQIASGKSLRQIEGNRKILGDMFTDPTLAKAKTEGEKAINAIYGPLREDMGAFIETAADKATRIKWANANKELAQMAGELKSGGLKRVLSDAEATPENVGKLLFSAKPSEVQRLYQNLSPAGQAKARSAIVQRAFDKAVSADGGLSVERFTNNLKSMGSPIGVLFKGADKESIAGLTRLLDATRRASAAGVTPPTGVQNLPVAAGYSLGSLFGAGAIPVAGAGGVLARIYESAPVRNLLLRLAKTAPGSRAEESLLRQLTPRLTAIAANNNEVGGALSSKVGVPLAASDGEENE